ncbi:hypothetical protein [Phaeocystidibacter luteus]|uniref:Uncharacterized protein n=1 Tax=Phaeocystidibacter luteus TaxID=911197 RepID=A0A6N6RKY8_9FLAO|nr:hypothetical protein [Phaeocystidibacter luteus]KAB2814099.1 hypothetical protein F8C67_05295 [Phaeocystidibacter luteus]
MIDKVFQYSVVARDEENTISVLIPWHFGDINVLWGEISPTPLPLDNKTEWKGNLGRAEHLKGKTLKLLVAIKEFDKKEAKIITKWNDEEITPAHQSNNFPISEAQTITVKLVIDIK